MGGMAPSHRIKPNGLSPRLSLSLWWLLACENATIKMRDYQDKTDIQVDPTQSRSLSPKKSSVNLDSDSLSHLISDHPQHPIASSCPILGENGRVRLTMNNGSPVSEHPSMKYTPDLIEGLLYCSKWQIRFPFLVLPALPRPLALALSYVCIERHSS